MMPWRANGSPSGRPGLRCFAFFLRPAPFLTFGIARILRQLKDYLIPPRHMSYYSKHVFFCCNQRDGGRVCCNDKGASQIRDYAKKRVKELGLSGEGKIRVNQAGCLDRCEEGPCVVVYPDAVWYTYLDRADID